MIRITPDFYVVFWGGIMLTCLVMGGLTIWKLHQIVALLREILTKL